MDKAIFLAYLAAILCGLAALPFVFLERWRTVKFLAAAVGIFGISMIVLAAVSMLLE